jgi:acetate---CoA ligase (ADP-forming)
VAEVATPAELIETLKIFHHCGPQIGPRLCSLSCSGGEAGLVADLAAPFGIDFPPPSEAQRERLGEILGPIVFISNPLDYHTFIWGDGPRTTDVFTTMLAGYDAGIFIIDPPRRIAATPPAFSPRWMPWWRRREYGKPAFAVASLPENFDEALAMRMAAPMSCR